MVCRYFFYLPCSKQIETQTLWCICFYFETVYQSQPHVLKPSPRLEYWLYTSTNGNISTSVIATLSWFFRCCSPIRQESWSVSSTSKVGTSMDVFTYSTLLCFDVRIISQIRCMKLVNRQVLWRPRPSNLTSYF